MTVTLAQVEADIGELYDSMDNGTTAVALIISRAQTDVNDITSNYSSYDSLTRPLADSYCVQQFLGSLESPDQKIGPLSVGKRELVRMRDEFNRQFESAAQRNGFNMQGQKARFKITFID